MAVETLIRANFAEQRQVPFSRQAGEEIKRTSDTLEDMERTNYSSRAAGR